MLIDCPSCQGKGIIKYFEHVQNGKCFSCNGKGKINDQTITNKDIKRQTLKRELIRVKEYMKKEVSTLKKELEEQQQELSVINQFKEGSTMFEKLKDSIPTIENRISKLNSQIHEIESVCNDNIDQLRKEIKPLENGIRW